jgi:hypothetical protein
LLLMMRPCLKNVEYIAEYRNNNLVGKINPSERIMY